MKIVFILTTIFLSIQAHSQTKKCAEEFKAAGGDLVASARNNGWSNLGNLSLATLEGKVRSSEVKVVCLEPRISITQSNRPGARFVSGGEKIVQLNKAGQDAKPEEKSLLSLHEHLGALGLDDREGQISTSIQIMKERPFNKALPINAGPRALEMNARKGTSTGVAGGGDGAQLSVKAKLLSAYLDSLELEDLAAPDRISRTQSFLDLEIRFYYADQRNLAPAPIIKKLELRDLIDPKRCSWSAVSGVEVGVQFLNEHGFQELFKYLKVIADRKGSSGCDDL